MARIRQHSASGFHILVNWGQFVHLPLFLYWGLEVLKILNLKSTDIREITLSPNRQNIKLRISKVSNEVEIAMARRNCNDMVDRCSKWHKGEHSKDYNRCIVCLNGSYGPGWVLLVEEEHALPELVSSPSF